MSTFLVRAGCVLAFIGTLVLSGAEDLLPLEIWAWMHGIPAGAQYFRLVPAEGGHSFMGLTVLGAGIAVAAVGWILRVNSDPRRHERKRH